MILLIKLIGIIALIIFLLQKKVKLSYVMLIAAFVVAVIFDIGVSGTIDVTIDTIFDKDTINIVVLLALIIALEKVMSHKQLMSRMVTSLKNIVGDYKITSLILPAIIGILPSAGGAIFSAPMIAEVCSGVIVENENKSFINYWYRHVWEYVFPIYTGIILASAVLNVEIEELISLFYPYTILNIIIGIPIAFYYFPKNIADRPKEIRKNLKIFILNSYPIILILILFFIFKINIVITTLITLISLIIAEKVNASEFWSIYKGDNSFITIVTVISIIYFKNMLIESKTIEEMLLVFNSVGISNVYIALLLPLIIGIMTGMTSAVVGITFPVVMNLGGSIDFNLITLAYVSGSVGVMMSPMHLCFTLTTEFFKADFNKVWIRVATGQIFILLCGLAAYLYF